MRSRLGQLGLLGPGPRSSGGVFCCGALAGQAPLNMDPTDPRLAANAAKSADSDVCTDVGAGRGPPDGNLNRGWAAEDFVTDADRRLLRRSASCTCSCTKKTGRFRWSSEHGGDLTTCTLRLTFRLGVDAAVLVSGVIGHCRAERRCRSRCGFWDQPDCPLGVLIAPQPVPVVPDFSKSGTRTGTGKSGTRTLLSD